MHAIRLARPEDAPLLPPIERSAGELFRGDSDLAWIADGDVQSVERHMEFIAKGTAWVATGLDDTPLAFLNGEEIGGCFHIWEMSVHQDHQRKGLGSTLIEQARLFALSKGYPALTLTTFKKVAWNDVFYSRLGFKLVERAQLSDELVKILAREAANGLPSERRCAMTMALAERPI